MSGAGKLTQTDLREIGTLSNKVIGDLAREIPWLDSYVTRTRSTACT